MGDDVYQDPSTATVTTKPDDPFNDDVYQDPTAAMATKNLMISLVLMFIKTPLLPWQR